MRFSFLLCCWPVIAFAQPLKKPDLTANQVMMTYQITSPNNLEKLIQWLNQQPMSVGDSGVMVATLAAKMAQHLKKGNEEALAYYHHAAFLIHQGKEDSVIPALEKAKAIKTTIHDSITLKLSYTYGLALYNLDNFEECISKQKATITMANRIGHKRIMANAYNNMGGAYLRQSKYSNALASYLDALHLYQAINDLNRSAVTLSNIGLTYKYLEQLDKAIEYTFKSIQLQQKLGDTAKTADLWMQLGNIKNHEGKLAEALPLLLRALALSKRYKLPNTAAYSTNNIAIAYTDLGNIDSGWHYALQGEALLQQIQDEYNSATIQRTKVRLLLQASDSWLMKHGLTRNSANKQAMTILQAANDASARHENIYGLAEGTELEMALWEKSMNTAKALDAAKRLLVLKDTLNSDESREEIVRAEMKYAQQQQEAVMKAKFEGELRVQRQVRITTISVAILVLLGTGAFFVQFKKRQAEKRIQLMAEFNAAVAETEMKALRSQMNPHFIFNALNSIADYIRKNESAIADAYLTKFARLIRMVLENSAQKEITLQSELETLQLYLELEAMRMQHKFSFSIDVAPSINRQTTEVPPLLLQPFVENSIWHGIAPNKDPGHIAIKIVPGVSQQIVCLIEDNGVGLRTEPFLVNPKKSMGLDITQQRLELIQRRTGIDAGFELKPALQGVLASIRIPVLS
jgi:tetratricopeptide (TPR) repeat protein